MLAAFSYATPGDVRGGDGVVLTNGSTIFVDDTTIAGGNGGYYDTKCGSGQMVEGGVPFQVQAGSEVQLADDPIVTLVSRTTAFDGTPLSVSLNGPAGAAGFLLWAEEPGLRPFGTMIGLLHLDGPSLVIAPLGTIPTSGTLETSFAPPPVRRSRAVGPRTGSRCRPSPSTPASDASWERRPASSCSTPCSELRRAPVTRASR